jgi:Domain of unknown function (DUF4129)
MLFEPPEPTHDPDEVRRTADEILSRPQYQQDSGDSLIEQIDRWLEELLEGFGGGGGTQVPSFVSWLVLGVLLALIVALVVWAVRSGGWGRRRVAETEAPVILGAEETRSADAWRAEAERHEAAGRWREGLLCRYRALVTELAQAEVVAEAAGRTTGELMREVSVRRPDAAAPFTTATDLFETAWYGGVETGPDERDRFVALAGDTLGQVRSRDRVSP